MAIYFVKQTAIVATPADTNDGLCPIGFNLSAATFTTSTKNLNKTGAFTSYTWQAGDIVYISGGTGVVAGLYEIASKTDNDNIVLVEDIGGTNPSDVTSSNGPFATIAQGETSSSAFGSEVRICADATYTLTAAVVWDFNASHTSGMQTCSGANSRGIVDGTRPTINFSGTAATHVFNVSGSYHLLQHLNIDATSTNYPVWDTGANNRYYKCRFRTSNALSNSVGLYADANYGPVYVVDCEVTSDSSPGTTADGFYCHDPYMIYSGCSAHDMPDIGFNIQTSWMCVAEKCLSYKNTNHGFNAPDANYKGLQISGCTSHGNGGSGAHSDACVNDNRLWVTNSILANNSSYGVHRNTSANNKFESPGWRNLFWQNSLGPTPGPIENIEYDYVQGDPKFVNTGAGTEDYALQSDSAAKDAGADTNLPLGGTGYQDIGAMQRQAGV